MNLFAVSSITLLLLAPPPPGPAPFTPPAQALPWPLVTFPAIAAPDTITTIDWAEPTHSEEYQDQEPEIITAIDNWISPIEDMAASIEDLLDMDDAPTYDETGEVDTGLISTGGGALTTASTLASLGTSIGTMFSWVRMLALMPFLESGSLILVTIKLAVDLLGLMIGLNLLILLIKLIILAIKIANPVITILLAVIKRI